VIGLHDELQWLRIGERIKVNSAAIQQTRKHFA